MSRQSLSTSQCTITGSINEELSKIYRIIRSNIEHKFYRMRFILNEMQRIMEVRAEPVCLCWHVIPCSLNDRLNGVFLIIPGQPVDNDCFMLLERI